MSSRSEADPADRTPEQRQADWHNRAAVRERVSRGAAMFGADRFYAFLTLPEVDIASETLHDDFRQRYNGSYRTRRRALEAFVDCASLTNVLRYYVEPIAHSGTRLGLNYEAIGIDFDEWTRTVEMGDRIHVFWRFDASDE